MSERSGQEAHRAQKVPASEMPTDASMPQEIRKRKVEQPRSADQTERFARQLPLGGERADNGND